jgi:hemoglobin
MRRAPIILVLIGGALAGCGGGGGEARVSSSGDPQADRRAEQRVGASETASGKAAPAKTLYERLGGEAGISAIVDDMTERCLSDPRVNFERRDVKTNWLGATYKPWERTTESIAQFKRQMVEFLSLASGGPSKYSGRDLKTIHKGMQITNNQFDAMVGDIKTSMDKLGIATREKRDLLAIVETTRKQIVERP